MGLCNAVAKNDVIIEKSMNYDFETFREQLKESGGSKVFEVKAKLYEIQEVNKRARKILISKYLFFKPDGKFTSKIKKGNDDLLLEGLLEKNGVIKFSIKQRMIEENRTKIKIYEGNCTQSNDKGLKFTGKIYECDLNEENEKIEKQETFELDFSNTLWKVEYTSKKNKLPTQTNLFLYYKNNIFSGISFDDRGFGTWAGIEKNEGKVVLVQQYLDKSYSSSSENGIFSFAGVIDKISFIIDGKVTSSELDDTPNFTIKKVGKLYKEKK
jgi:hypothetical protein